MIFKYKIKHIIYEGIFAKPIWNPKTRSNTYNIDTVKKLAKIQSSLEDTAYQMQITSEEFPVNEWRSYLPIKFKSTKRENVKKDVCNYIILQYPKLKNETEDTLEATSMGLAWINKQNKYMEYGQSTTE